MCHDFFVNQYCVYWRCLLKINLQMKELSIINYMFQFYEFYSVIIII